MLVSEILPNKKGSHVKVDVCCDMCFSVYSTEYRYVFRYRNK